MDCIQTSTGSDSEYFREFNRMVADQRVPVFGSIDLTHRCNLRCVHCYLGGHAGERGTPELDGGQIARIVDEVTEAGCLDLLLTGGEPFLRRDFAQIYRHAKMNGLLVTIFSNGTLIGDEVVELFVDLPPRAVGITVYGATAETYESITGVGGSYDQCMAGIEKLLGAGIHVDLRTVLMTLNRHEFSDIRRMAEERGARFRFDPAIFPRFDGDRGPLDLRVSAREAVEKERLVGKGLEKRREFFEVTRALPMTDKLYKCGAGLTTFHVDPDGTLRPCIMARRPRYDLLDGSFAVGWRDVISQVRAIEAPDGFACSRCELITLCDYCPPFFELEGGSKCPRSEFMCAMTQHRHRAIQDVCVAKGRTGSQDE